jgi:predicted RNase H-like HicB family nuclease
LEVKVASYTALIDGKAGAYGVHFPDLPGCTAMGATLEEAIVNAAEAMRDWVDVTVAKGGVIPEPRALEELLADQEISDEIGEGALLRSVPLVRESGRPAKANLSIDAGVLAAIDAEAKRRKLTRSAFIELMARHALPEMTS